ncbi:Sperm-associated antigen 8 [Bagarius yarrelli]|uniref:Sperm-associated antigen 8 n=1 Tax=Bagarius yarrelli TaxID=175774 RepID=A0A556TYD1_BAGYA|nr:Sperm-associated antigen 8 [Bagarius yarrelli]
MTSLTGILTESVIRHLMEEEVTSFDIPYDQKSIRRANKQLNIQFSEPSLPQRPQRQIMNEEQKIPPRRATIELDNSGTASDIQKHGHRDILTVDVSSKLNGVSTLKSAFTSPYGTRVRQKGLRSELLQKHLMKSISEQVNAELTPQPVVPELYSVTRTDYSVEGFQCVQPTPSTDRDYRTDEAITFWRENVDKVQVQRCIRVRTYVSKTL